MFRCQIKSNYIQIINISCGNFFQRLLRCQIQGKFRIYLNKNRYNSCFYFNLLKCKKSGYYERVKKHIIVLISIEQSLIGIFEFETTFIIKLNLICLSLFSKIFIKKKYHRLTHNWKRILNEVHFYL